MLGLLRSVSDRRLRAHLSLAAGLSLTGTAAMVLDHFPPTAYGFYPLCPVHEYLHLECPGCGTTRALAALLHGHLAEALHLNALAIGIVLPLAAAYGVILYLRAVRDDNFCWPQFPKPAIYAGIAMIAAFTVQRNL